jgi:hypothetical protein
MYVFNRSKSKALIGKVLIKMAGIQSGYRDTESVYGIDGLPLLRWLVSPISLSLSPRMTPIDPDVSAPWVPVFPVRRRG